MVHVRYIGVVDDGTSVRYSADFAGSSCKDDGQGDCMTDDAPPPLKQASEGDDESEMLPDGDRNRAESTQQMWQSGAESYPAVPSARLSDDLDGLLPERMVLNLAEAFTSEPSFPLPQELMEQPDCPSPASSASSVSFRMGSRSKGHGSISINLPRFVPSSFKCGFMKARRTARTTCSAIQKVNSVFCHAIIQPTTRPSSIERSGSLDEESTTMRCSSQSPFPLTRFVAQSQTPSAQQLPLGAMLRGGVSTWIKLREKRSTNGKAESSRLIRAVPAEDVVRHLLRPRTRSPPPHAARSRAQPVATRSQEPHAARCHAQPAAAHSPQPHAASSRACPARVPACAARCCLACCLRKRAACCCPARCLRSLSAASYCPASCLLPAASVLACGLLPAACCLPPPVCCLLPTAFACCHYDDA
ncbi:unnamed protein product [Closterium sp. NIES-54]